MILVTGATGLVGSHLLCTLLEKGENLRALYRDDARIELWKQVAQYYPGAEANISKLEWIKGDLLDLSSLEIACDGVKQIYHAAAYISFDPSESQKLRKINIEGTANLVNTALSKGVEQFCHISSVATLGENLDATPINEQTEWNPQNPGSGYAISKYGAEMEVWRGSQEGLIISMVLPGIILGEGLWKSASGSLIPRAAKGIPFYTPGSSGFVDVKDVVKASILVANSVEAGSQKYVLVGTNTSYKSLFELVAKETGVKPPKRKVAKWLMRILAFLAGVKSKFSRKPRALTQGLVDSLYYKEVYSSAKIEKQFDFKFTPLPQTVKRICKALNGANL